MRNFLICVGVAVFAASVAAFGVMQLAVYVEIQDKQAGYYEMIDDELFAGGK